MEQVIKFINNTFYWCRLTKYTFNSYFGTIYNDDILIPMRNDDDGEIFYMRKNVFMTPYVKFFLTNPSCGSYNDYMRTIGGEDFIYTDRMLMPRSQDDELYFI